MQNNTISNYFKSVAKNKLLTKEEEIILAKRIEGGDREAKNIMIQSNLRLAISMAKKYTKYCNDMEDLIQESNMGLIKAVDKFDWRKGYKFSTYACWWIKQAITRYLTLNNTILKIPSHVKGNARKIYQLHHEYIEEFKQEPTHEELSEASGLSIKHVKEALRVIKIRHVLSIDKPVNDENNRTLGDILPDYSKSVEDKLQEECVKKEIIKAFKTLTKREEIILRLRFGISDVPIENILMMEEK